MSLGLSIGSLAFYDRAGLEYLANCHFEEVDFYGIIEHVDELFITAFDYNGMQPRFYSRFFGKIDGGRQAV